MSVGGKMSLCLRQRRRAISKEKAIKYIKAAQTAIDEAPYPCTTKAKILLAEALKESED